MKQYEEEINYKLLTQEEQEAGLYFKLNEKVLLRTDSKTQMEIFASGINNGVYKPNEARRKLDLTDEEGGDQLIVNGNYIPLVSVGTQYISPNDQAEGEKAEEKTDDQEESGADPAQTDEENAPDQEETEQKEPEQEPEAGADDKDNQEGGEEDEQDELHKKESEDKKH